MSTGNKKSTYRASQNNYFRKFGDLLSRTTPKTLYEVEEVQQKIQGELENGQLNLPEQNSMELQERIKKMSENIQIKNSILSKQLMLLNIRLRKNHQSELKPRKKISSARSLGSFRSSTEVTETDMTEYDKKSKAAAKKLRQLKKMKQDAHEKRIRIESEKKFKEEAYQRQKRRKEIEDQRRKKSEKQQMIKGKLKDLQQKRNKRIELLKSSLVKSESTPLYKKMQQNYEHKQLQTDIINKIRVNEQIMQKYKDCDYEAINKHDKEYIRRVREQFNRNPAKQRAKTQQIKVKHRQWEANFRLVGEDPAQITKRKQQRSRVKEFQEVSSRVRVKTNIDKFMQMQLSKDKLKNPFKYHFLKNKKYSELQIYKGFADFQLNSNARKLGNQYMISANANAKKIRDSSSSRAVLTEPIASPPPKDYLKENKKMASRRKRNSTQELISQFSNKSKAIQYMQDKARSHNAKAIHKITELKRKSKYEDVVKAEAEIDEQFLQSLKSRVKCLQIQ